MTRLASSNTSDRGGSVSEPVGSGISEPPTPPATSSIDFAVSTLGEILNLAFDDARRLDQYGRQVISAFGDIDHDARVELGNQHPGLVGALLLLENQIQRMDQR